MTSLIITVIALALLIAGLFAWTCVRQGALADERDARELIARDARRRGEA